MEWNMHSVVSAHTSVHVFKENEAVCWQQGMFLHVESVFMLCQCVNGWYTVGIPVCQVVRWRRHSSHCFLSIKQCANDVILCFLSLFYPYFVFSLSFCPVCWLSDDSYLMNTTNWLWLKSVLNSLAGEGIKDQTATCENGSISEKQDSRSKVMGCIEQWLPLCN